MSSMDEESNTTKEREERESRKRRRRSKGSQTSEELDESNECTNCKNMADVLCEINAKLDVALAKIEEVDKINKKLVVLQKENTDLKDSLNFAYEEINDLKKKTQTQASLLEQVHESTKNLDKCVNEEKQRAIRLESHSRRNNLNFFNIPENREENFSKTEAILREFLECELQISKNEVQEISIERAHRIGKRNPYPSHKPRPIIAKFSFFKDQQYVLSKSRSLAGTNYGISEDYPKEIVEIRKSLIPLMKEAKKNGQRAKLVLDKLYIDGKLVDQQAT
ncbi:hypothetical protein QZH41_000814 [Actinostola sp. cb2023]|nr:hypothetical protein QZH41_000814 [Actinostola sp. cb2023]